MPPSSDPFDDYDDLDFDPATLKEIEALEKRASSVSATQSKKYHHTVAKPAKGRPAPAPKPSVPRPINTNPRTSGCGMGWEPGGKHAIKYEPGGRYAPPPLASQRIDEESLPVDVVVDEHGRYTAASQDEVIDQKTRPEIRQMVENAARTAPPPSLPGSQARREAIFSAMAEAGPGPSTTANSRQFQRSNSSSAVPSSTPRVGGNRSLARAASTGSNVFNRQPPTKAALQPGLPPITASQGSSSSQGAAARRVAGELEDERRKREASEAEVRALKAQIAQLQASSTTTGQPKGTFADEADIEVLRQQLWTAQGQAATAKRNQETIVSKLQEELEKARMQNQQLEAQMRARELEAKQKLESMRTQAVFSNHNAMASASKARHQSQWSSSQRAGAPTPLRASPLKEKIMRTPAPLTRSVSKAKDRPPPPQFGQLQNAFTRTPATSRKRQRTEALSPTSTPRKAQQYSSPAASPIRSQDGHVASDADVGMDWQPDFGGFDDGANMGVATTIVVDRDTKTELQHHLLSHSVFTPMATYVKDCQPSIFRLMTSEPLQEELVPEWQKLCNGLLSLIHDTKLPYDDGFCERLLGTLVRLVEIAVHGTFLEHLDEARNIEFLPTLVVLLRLVSSTVFIFPSFVPGSHANTGDLELKLLEVSQFLTPAKAETVNGWWSAALARFGSEAKSSWEEELADAVAEVGEALCLNSNRSQSWSSNCLSELILNLAQSERPFIVGRALDLFAVAAIRDEFFRALLFPREGFQGGAPVIDRVSRFLVTPPPSMSKEQVHRHTVSVLSGLFILARHNADAVVLLAEQSVLAPSLLMLLYRESVSIWGIRSEPVAHDTLALVLPTLQLLHHLVYPAPLPRPSSSLATPTKDDEEITPQGVDLARKLQEPGEYTGLSHLFVATLGGIAYAEVDIDDGAWAYAALVPRQERRRKMDLNDLRLMQFLAQDLLERVVEGPEGDTVYEVFAEQETQPSPPPHDEGEEEEYDEEERVMDDWPGMED